MDRVLSILKSMVGMNNNQIENPRKIELNLRYNARLHRFFKSKYKKNLFTIVKNKCKNNLWYRYITVEAVEYNFDYFDFSDAFTTEEAMLTIMLPSDVSEHACITMLTRYEKNEKNQTVCYISPNILDDVIEELKKLKEEK